jgi:DNA polymerase-3 subunit beta
MKLEIKREQLLKPLQHVIGVVERRQTLPILSNVLLVARQEELICTATDMEVELSSRIELAKEEATGETTKPSVIEPGETTLPARKLLDILRALPEDATVRLSVDAVTATLRCGRSRFTLLTLPAAEFPTLGDLPFEGNSRLSQRTLKTLIERTHFAMAQQDVRYYLNGLLLEVDGNRLRAVATDGHRLALREVEAETTPAAFQQQVIVPRKGVQELLRLLDDTETETTLKLGTNHVQTTVDGIRLTSKLIDGKFPDYQRVIPREGELVIIADRLALKTALSRAAILANEKYRGVRLQAENWLLRIQAHNPEQEEAEEEVEVNYNGGPLEIGFNVTYLLDALSALPGELVRLSFTDASSSCLIQEPESGTSLYVVMPMRL